MKFELGPTGQTIVGHVLDVNKRGLEEALQFYDKQLYVRWNPRKLQGWGCWEVRRRPEKSTVTFQGKYGSAYFFKLEKVEVDMVHHVMDAPYLNYDILTKLKRMDTWNDKNWVDNLEHEEEAYRAKAERRQREELVYNMMQYKTAFREYREAILSGDNPAALAKFWGSIQNAV